LESKNDEVDIVIASDITSILKIETLARDIWSEHYTAILPPGQVEYMLSKMQSAAAIKKQIEDGYMYYLVIDRETREIGYLAFIKKENDFLLSKVYLKKEYRGKGYGRQAIEFVTHVAKLNKAGKVTLYVNKNNTGAIAAYKKYGFKIIRALVTDIGGGYVMDDLIMEKAVDG